ncbi:MAG TPA: hypothetical protein VGN82_08840 [Bosea sp. (in: a-proteobacteria)]|jgi:hypothetical protein|uniref:hypothetical protein n=1 Tax=Bosea sp. (in: a-proteobacteria) TaxID=1871050 RepID=UPI002E129BDC|nr:hypothetical protein [Bosea sp. (in: a-proteobacteria)]
MKTVMKFCRLPAAILCCWPLIACTSSSEPPVATSAPISMPLPAQRSYLDPGPVAPSTGGPNYVRANQSSGPRQTDFFGNDVLPQTP